MRELELHILSSALMSRDDLFKVLQYTDSIFTQHDIRQCRNLLAKLFETEPVIDLPVFYAALENNPQIKRDNIISEIAKLGKCYNIDSVLDQLDERRMKLSIKDKAQDVINALNDGSLNFDEIIDSLIEEYSENKMSQYTDLITYITENDLDSIFESIQYIRTGIGPIDAKIRGIYGGQLILIAARPGCGKTTLAIEIAQSCGEHVLFFSLEMIRQEIYAKMLSRETSIEAEKIIFNRISDTDRIKIMNAHEELKKSLKITLFDGGINLKNLVYHINHYVNYKKPKLIIVDYIQLLSGAKGENQNIRTGIISRTLKILAMKHKIPIIAMSQLSRANEKEKRKPQLSDLRDSGSLEQDANIVIFLHENDEGFTEVGIAKNRMGRTGPVYGLRLEKEYSRFIDIGV
jgi:replicative DNA helicase